MSGRLCSPSSSVSTREQEARALQSAAGTWRDARAAPSATVSTNLTRPLWLSISSHNEAYAAALRGAGRPTPPHVPLLVAKHRGPGSPRAPGGRCGPPQQPSEGQAGVGCTADPEQVRAGQRRLAAAAAAGAGQQPAGDGTPACCGLTCCPLFACAQLRHVFDQMSLPARQQRAAGAALGGHCRLPPRRHARRLCHPSESCRTAGNNALVVLPYECKYRCV